MLLRKKGCLSQCSNVISEGFILVSPSPPRSSREEDKKTLKLLCTLEKIRFDAGVKIKKIKGGKKAYTSPSPKTLRKYRKSRSPRKLHSYNLDHVADIVLSTVFVVHIPVVHIPVSTINTTNPAYSNVLCRSDAVFGSSETDYCRFIDVNLNVP